MRQPPQTVSGDRYAVRAVDRALSLLLIFSSGEKREYTLGELAEAAGLEKPTVHRLVRTLEARGFMERRMNGLYGLGTIHATLGSVVVESWDLRRLMQPTLSRLVAMTGETAFCSILEGREVLTVASLAGQQRLRIATVPGERAPAAVTADGKVLLAHQPAQEAAELMAEESRRHAGEERSWLAQRLRELAEVRREGVGYDIEDHLPGLSAVAIPLLGEGGGVTASLGVAAPASRLEGDRLSEVTRILKANAPDRIPWSVQAELAVRS